jgi:hypothetical protein
MKIRREVSTKPGRLPVVQVTEVEVAAETGQSMPSIMIEYFEVSVENPVPVKVTTVPPTTVPCLGETAVRVGVIEPTYSTELRDVSVYPVMSLALQVYDASELSIVSTPVKAISLIAQAP